MAKTWLAGDDTYASGENTTATMTKTWLTGDNTSATVAKTWLAGDKTYAFLVKKGDVLSEIYSVVHLQRLVEEYR